MQNNKAQKKPYQINDKALNLKQTFLSFCVWC